MRVINLTLLVALCVAIACEAGEDKLTPAFAKKLMPKASSMSVDDLQALAQSQGEKVDIKSKSLTYAILAHRPSAEVDKDAEKEFRFIGNLNIAKLAKTISASKEQGYATFLQLEFLTDCTCESTGDKAKGTVAFKSDLYEGRIQFQARKLKAGWAITEFHMPKHKIKVVRGDDGNWIQKGPDAK